MVAKQASIKKRHKAPSLFVEIGSTGLRQWAGRVDEEWLTQLASPEKRIKIFREMRDNDPVIGAILYAIEMLVRQASWYVEAAGKEQEFQDDAEFLESCLHDMSSSWEDTIAEILSFLPFGFSIHELVYKRRNGYKGDTGRSSQFDDAKIGWRKLPIRAQDTVEEWLMDDAGGIKGFVQNAPPKYERVEIEIPRLLLFRYGLHKGNPEGRSIMRNAFRPWFFKKRIEEVEGIGIERDLAGLPVIYAPSRIMQKGATPEEKSVYQELQRIVKNIRRDEQEGIIIPGDRDASGNLRYELQLLSAGGSRQFNTSEVVTRYDQRIAVTVLADFILLGTQTVGSFALSSSKTALFGVALGTFLDSIASVMNQFAVPRLFRVNGRNMSMLPKLKHGDVETPDLTELGDFIVKLAGAGMPLFPDEELENRLRTLAKLPLREFGDKDGADVEHEDEDEDEAEDEDEDTDDEVEEEAGTTGIDPNAEDKS